MPSKESDFIMPEYTYIIGSDLGTEVVFEEGAGLNCSFEIEERTPCDPLYRLLSWEEGEDGTVTVVLEKVDA